MKQKLDLRALAEVEFEVLKAIEQASSLADLKSRTATIVGPKPLTPAVFKEVVAARMG